MNLTYSFIVTFFRIFLPFALGFVISCYLRTMNAVLIPTLEQFIHIRPDQLGLLNSVYFLAHALFQVPVGNLLDRYGARKVQSSLFLVACVGLLLSALSKGIVGLAIGRILVGIGMAAGMMAALKVIVQWFSSEYIATLNGFVMAFGGIGLLLSAAPTQILADILGWTRLNLFYCFVVFAASLAILIVVPETTHAIQKSPIKDQLKVIALIYRDRFFWKVTPITASVLGGFMAVHGLWIENWFRYTTGTNQHGINKILMLMAIAMTISLFTSGLLIKFANYLQVPLLGFLRWVFIVYIFTEVAIIVTAGQSKTWFLWILIGFLSQMFNLSYSILTNHYQKVFSGRANTAMSVVVFVTAFAVQYAIGISVSRFSSLGTMEAYKISLIIPIVIQVCCLLFSTRLSADMTATDFLC